MKKIVVLTFVVVCSLTSFSPVAGVVGAMFPTMDCEDYNGNSVVLPEDTMGKHTLLGMAFSKQAEMDLKTWMQPIYNKFIDKTDNSAAGVFDVSASYDINLYFVPMFTGANQVASKSSKEKIKAMSEKELYPHLLFYEGANSYKKELDFEKKDIPYFFVIDEKGVIVYATSGKYDSKKMEAILDILDEN